MLKATGSHAAHLLMEALIGLTGLFAIAGCVLAWRLGQGPIDITQLAQRELFRVQTAGARISIGHAEIAWEGFRDPGSAVDIRWRDLALANAAGETRAALPAGRVTLSMVSLVHGVVAPRQIEVDRGSIVLVRGADGTLHLDLGQDSGDGPPAAPPVTQSLSHGPQSLVRVPFLAQLRHVRLRDTAFTLRDQAGAQIARAFGQAIDLQRDRSGSVTGSGTVDLVMGDARLNLGLNVAIGPSGTTLSLRTSQIDPVALAAAVPRLAPLAALAAPVQITATATLGQLLELRQATADLTVGAGTLRAGTGAISVASATASIAGTPNDIHLTRLRIVQRPAHGSTVAPPVITAAADATRGAAGWACSFALSADRVAFADLAAYWPTGTGGGARPWITGNITAGIAQNLRVAGALRAAADFSNMDLTSVSGGMDASNITLHWLRPVPPIDHATARLTIDSPDALHIDIPSGDQGPLSLSGGRVTITGLAHKDQAADITVRAAGGLQPMLALLNHPRLRLLSRRPISLVNPAGTLTANLHVTLPLAAAVSFDDIGINATAQMQAVHLGAIAAGYDLDQGDLSLKVDANALSLSGTGRIGGMPADLGVDMDFRGGPPSQVLEHYTARAHPTAAQLAAFGSKWITAGQSDLDVDYAAHRDGSGLMDVHTDLTKAAVELPIAWTKSAGQAASAHLRLRLQGGDITSIDQLSATGPDLAIASHAVLRPGQPRTLVLDQLQVGGTRATGSITLPPVVPNTAPPAAVPPSAAQPGAKAPTGIATAVAATPAPVPRAIVVVLRGPTLDLSAWLQQRAHDTTPATEDDDAPGPPWSVDLAFAQLTLASDETLAPLTLTAASDGHHILRAKLAAGAAGQVRANLTPAPRGRHLSIISSDAGSVLLASGVADNIRGGKLEVTGDFDDRSLHSPLSGTATLETFRVLDGPAIGRLLKAMTLYGAVDLLRGPGLGFARAVVPFHWRQQVLTLDNARAFSASLGLTAKGTIDLRQHRAGLEGTIVPAYFFNQLLGNIPLLGRLFSPETGGGVFAATYAVRGPLKDPAVTVNPLSALTPGVLRKLFGLF